MIDRGAHVSAIRGLFRIAKVVAILGARQVGKTTLARQYAKRERAVTVLDLEDPDVLARLADPMMALRPLRGLVIIDEIQRRPELFPVLRVLADRPRSPARFLVLGSASPELLRQSSETLAGRIAYHELGGFSMSEVGATRLERLWLRGGFPRAFLARSDRESDAWRRQLARTYLERDLPELGVTIPAATLRRFWNMLAHWNGQIWNASEFGRAFGVADTTVRRYLDLLAATYAIRLLQPFHANLAKRQVRSPKVYFSDSGVLHNFLGVRSSEELLLHPRVGASWEGFGIEQILVHLGARPDECHFWGTHTGAELDLLIVRGQRRFGFEIKRTEGPSITPSMRSALADLRLDRLDVIHAGAESYPLGDRIRAVALRRLLDDLEPLG